MRFVEPIIDYSIAIKEETRYGLILLSRIILLSALPLITVTLIGAVFYLLFVAVGWFVTLAFVSPSSAEKIIQDSYRNTDCKETKDNQVSND